MNLEDIMLSEVRRTHKATYRAVESYRDRRQVGGPRGWGGSGVSSVTVWSGRTGVSWSQTVVVGVAVVIVHDVMTMPNAARCTAHLTMAGLVSFRGVCFLALFIYL